MHRIKVLLTSILALVGVTGAMAHSPYEVNFNVAQEGERHVLTIHLTPQTIADLTVHLYPEKKGETVFNFSDHLEAYQAYFNEQLTIIINGEVVALEMSEGDLTKHDSFLKFTLNTNNSPVETLFFEVNAFEFYVNPKFYIQVSEANGQWKCQLDQQNNSCTLGAHDLIPKQHSLKLFGLVILAIVVLAVPLYRLFSRKS